MSGYNIAKIKGVKIAGLSACVPSHVTDNMKEGSQLFGDDIEAVVKTTGVEKRRTCPEGQITSLDLCIRSAEKLRETDHFDFCEIGGVVCVTQTPDLILPNNSTYAQELLGLPQSAAAFDINLACSGYLYGLWVAGMASLSLNKSILLLDGDTHSHFVSTKDRSTAILFGDAGSATIIEPTKEETEWAFSFITDGSKRDALIIPEGGFRNRINESSSLYKEYPDGGVRRGIDMKMDGMGVFNFVVRNVPKSLEYLIDQTQSSIDDFDILALHQANLFMVRQVAKKIKFPLDKVPISLQKFGNSSSATIPVTLASELEERVNKEKLRILASGFGAGLSVASASFELGQCVCTGVTEYEC